MIGSRKLDNVWVFVQLIHRPTGIKNQLYKKPYQFPTALIIIALDYSMRRSGSAGYVGGERCRSWNGGRARRLSPPLRGPDVRLGKRHGQRRQDGINRCVKFIIITNAYRVV